MLIGRDALLILDLCLHVVNGVGGLDLESNGLASEGLHEDLHTTTETEHQVESRLLLDVIVGQGATILELLSSEDEALLIGGNTLFVLNLGLDVVNSVRGLDLKGDSLASQSLDEDLHATAETEHQVQGGFLLDVVVTEGAAIFKLLASEDQTLLIGRDALLVLDLSLDIIDSVRRLDLESDSFARKGLDENLHSAESWLKTLLIINKIGDTV